MKPLREPKNRTRFTKKASKGERIILNEAEKYISDEKKN